MTRLSLLGECFDGTTRERFCELPVSAGWSVLEVGVGGGSLLAYLSDAVGPAGAVLATDVDPRVLRPAGAWPNVRMAQHDIRSDPLPDAEFDCIHARLVTHLFADRNAVLEKLVRALRPGGWLFLEDFDVMTVLRGPVDSYSACWSALHRMACRVGIDLSCGGRLSTVLDQLGLDEVKTAGEAVRFAGGTSTARLWALTLNSSRDFILSDGAVTSDDLDAALLKLAELTFCAVSPAVVAGWGRRPSSLSARA